MRDNRIDIIKGLATISVIILHTLPSSVLTSRIFHIDQAVPIFMLISGYVFTLSYKLSETTNLKSCYSLGILKKKIKRLYIPFLIIYVLELLLSKLFLSKNLDIFFIFKRLILGGFGPGSYYPVIMFQFILIIPIVYIISFKRLNYCIPFFFFLGIFFEFIAYMFGMSEGIYRLLIGRYIFVIALGCYLSLNEDRINSTMLYTGSIISILYMYLSVYFNLHIFGHSFWIPHQAPTYFYTTFLFITGMRILKKRSGIILSIFMKLGKASWHIFLIQMAYFWIIKFHLNIVFTIIINLILCVSIGYLFYVFESNLYSRETYQTLKIN